MMQLSTRHLRAFQAVADHGSVNRAAAALFRAQSAVTRSIHKLERELGVAMFERRARGMLPTAFGRALLTRTRRAFAEMQLARKHLMARSQGGTRSGNAPIFFLGMTEQRLLAFVALTEQHHMPSVPMDWASPRQR
jgi:LysR family transcriptional regulator, regulator for genes of the gallate degradation pathway